MVKQLQLFNRSAFYRKFVEHNFFVLLRGVRPEAIDLDDLVVTLLPALL